jgi:hypothetical protein
MGIKATLAAGLLALCVTGASADDIAADDWVGHCAAAEELYGWCAATASEVVKMIDADQQQRGVNALVCWTTRPPPRVGDFPTTAQTFWLKALVAVTVRYLRDNPSFAKMPVRPLMLAAFMHQWPCGGVGPLPK